MELETIRTGRLSMRPFTSADIPWVYEVSQDPVVRQFVELPSPYRLEDARIFVEELAIAGSRAGKRLEFMVEDSADATRLGRVGLGLAGAHKAEIGYWVDPRARSRGVATEAARAVCRWAFTHLGLEIIEWRAEVGNHASRRVAEKVGFLMEGTLRKRLLHRGTAVDAWVGSILRDEVLSGADRANLG
jgi:RimJ/RimL family protein N-acetyltransferase